MESSPEKIFELLKKERKTGELLPLESDFYDIAEELAKRSPNETEQQSLGRTLAAIREKRTQKILIYIAYNKELPSPTPRQEEDLYKQIKKILKRENSTPSSTRMRITADVPEIITTKGNRIGPFKQNQVVDVSDSDDTKFIIENKIGEMA